MQFSEIHQWNERPVTTWNYLIWIGPATLELLEFLTLLAQVAKKAAGIGSLSRGYTKSTHTKTKKRNNNQHSICPQEFLIQTRCATIAVNNPDLLCYSCPITEHCLKYQFKIANQPHSKNLYPKRHSHTQISHQTNQSRHRVPFIHLICCYTHRFFSSLVENGLPLFPPHSRTQSNFLKLGLILKDLHKNVHFWDSHNRTYL